MQSRNTPLLVKVLIFCALASVISPKLWGQSEQYQRQEAPPADPKVQEKKDKKNFKVDTSDLEQKYWAPKDTDFSVVQNRTYTKEKKVAVSLGIGQHYDDSFNEGYSYTVAANYFLNERYGFEVQYETADLKDSEATHVFKEKLSNGVSPDFGRIESYYGVGFNWVPFYAKMSFIGKKIMYFDMVITPHVGMTKYTPQSDNSWDGKSEDSFTYGLDVSQYFFFSKSVAARLDFKNRWFKEDIYDYRNLNAISGGDKLRTTTTNTTILMLGVMFMF